MSVKKYIPYIVVVVVLLVILLMRRWRKSERFSSFGKETIFISCASYRDIACSQTIEEIYSKASDPSRIYVGICEQNNDDSTESCTRDSMAGLYQDNIRKKNIPYTEAKGPTYARYLCSTLYNNETYFMQIDSHSKFEQNWDTIIIEQWKELHDKYGVQKPVLSNYPASQDAEKNSQVPVICRSSFNEDSIPTFISVLKEPKPSGEYYPTPFASGGFLFMKGLEVKFDPNLPHLFTGEEILYSARLYSHGYDIYAPRVNILYHHYERKGHAKFWEDIKDYKKIQQDTLVRVRYLLKISPDVPTGEYAKDIDRYGMGPNRTVEDYFNFASIDVANKVSTSEQKFC